MSQRFFSIIIPAHNEELIIEQTLRHLAEIDYPKDRYEVIIVENGSTDATYEYARRHESETIKVHQAPRKGVSHARNFGKTKCYPFHDWCIFMDADVSVKKEFLTELNTYLEAHPHVGYGTTTVQLDSDTLAAKVWSRLNAFTFRLFKFLFTIHIVRKDLSAKVTYNEELTSGEDTLYGRELARHGTYFFMPTKSVTTSARRFEKKGYLKMFFINASRGAACVVLPHKILKKLDWEVVR